MRKLIYGFAMVVMCGTLFSLGCSTSSKSPEPGKVVGADRSIPPADVQKIAEEAYIYGYPLVLMDITREQMTNVSSPSEEGAPMGQFVHKKRFPDANFTGVVSPNADTLYSTAWLDLSKEPMILSLPDTGDRYYLMPMLSAWTDVFASPGSRTTGNQKGDYAIVGPNWKGSLPAGVKEIKAPTNDVWIVGRTQTNGKEDYAAVQALQKQYRLYPLSAWGTSYTPPRNTSVKTGIDMRTPPVDQVERLSAEEFFKRMAASMKRNSPQTADAETVAQMVRIGLIPGRDFDPTLLTSDQRVALKAGADSGLAAIVKSVKSSEAKRVNGWVSIDKAGKYGNDFKTRAAVANFGLGANLPEDAVYFVADVDADGQPLSGSNRYVVRFARGQTPPVNAFWSLTLYNSKYFFAKNSLNRFTLGDRDKLQYNQDGSLEIYIQRQNPGRGKTANWLPAPSGNFSLNLRTYWPKQAILNGQWAPPAIQKVQDFKNLSENSTLK
ncbi:DUF1254 domain-containing protein [Bdellovibrio sp. HCB2-146]|uniref:DUF1254 domain-containing protein n=1 Tax=Bdellovibrio sp. HCB2-146 TaxID=3394362 RepID=UPI0039BCA464